MTQIAYQKILGKQFQRHPTRQTLYKKLEKLACAYTKMMGLSAHINIRFKFLRFHLNVGDTYGVLFKVW